MSMGTWVLVAWGVLVVAPFVTGALCFHYGRHHERTEGKHRRTSEGLDREWEDWRAQVTAPDPWDEPLKTPGEGCSSARRTNPAPLPRTYVTAADLPTPVVVPEPKLTDTGELRAIGERGAAIRAAMLTSELAWREKTRLQ